MKQRYGNWLASTVAALAAASTAFAQTASQTSSQAPADVLPDVTVRATGITPDKADVIATRMPRVARCLTPDPFSPDPSQAFNQAYYEELTGEAGFYEQIRAPKPKIRYTYPSALHPGENIFASLSGPMMAPGLGVSGGGGGRRPRPFNYTACLSRSAMEKSAPFARALALYDKGEYARALEALLAVHKTLGRSPMAGEVALMIADAYLKGEGTAKNAAEAIVWLKKAAATPGADRLPRRYDPKNPDRYYSVAAEARMALARIYMTGDGVEKNPGQARAWMEDAMRASHVPAFKIVADMNYAGFAGRLNQRDARMRYELAADLRHAAAGFSAGQMYDLGEGGKANRKRALDLYGMAGQLGSMPATYALAVAYDKGEGVKPDPERALSLYKIAAVGGEPAAQTAIGTYFYEGGSALGKDLAQARAWFGEAAIRGDVDGMVNLAAMLIKGEGGEVDLVKAYAWLYLANEGGSADAAAGLPALERRMTAADLEGAKALLKG